MISDPGWRNDELLFHRAMREVAHAGSDTFILVNSQPRTGSKFLHGVLVAAFGALSGMSFSVDDLIVSNPGHTHGLSDKRINSITGEKRTTQDLHVRALRKQFEKANRAVVFTALRGEESKIFSAFVVQKERLILDGGVAAIWEEFDRYRRGNSLDEWVKDEVTGVFGAPSFGLEAFAEPRAFERGSLIYVTVPLDQVESLLERYLYPVVSRSELEERSEGFQLHYGLKNRNTSRSRGLGFAHRKAAYILGAGDFQPL